MNIQSPLTVLLLLVLRVAVNSQKSPTFETCKEGIAQLIEECPQIDQLTQLAADLLARSIVQKKEFPSSCCQVISDLNEAECFCDNEIVSQFGDVISEEFLPSLLYQASQVEPAGCSIKIFASVEEKDKCAQFGNRIFPSDYAVGEEECTKDNLISDVISDTNNLQFLLEAIDLLDLQHQLDQLPSVTLFAPTDDAFEAWAEAEGIVPEDLFADEELLVTILARHIVVNATVIPQNIKDPERYKTLQGTYISAIVEDGEFQIQGYPTPSRASPACNGLLYKMNTVLWPANKTADIDALFKSATSDTLPKLFTAIPVPLDQAPFQEPVAETGTNVFVPTADSESSSSLNAQIMSAWSQMEFEDEEDEGPMLEPMSELELIALPKAVIDAIGMSRAISDEPCSINVYQLTTQFLPLFSEYLEYAEKQGLQDILKQSNGITIIIPINTAFSGKTEEEILSNWNPLNHIVTTEFSLADLGEMKEPLETLGGGVRVTTRPSGKVVIGGAEVVQSDVVGCNGRLQVVGQLILNSEVSAIAPKDDEERLNQIQTSTNIQDTKLPTSDEAEPDQERVPSTTVVDSLQLPKGDSDASLSPSPQTVPPFIRPTSSPQALDPTAPQTLESLPTTIAATASATGSISINPSAYVRPSSIQMPSPQIFNEPAQGGPIIPLRPSAVFEYSPLQRSPAFIDNTQGGYTNPPKEVMTPGSMVGPVEAPREYEGEPPTFLIGDSDNNNNNTDIQNPKELSPAPVEQQPLVSYQVGNKPQTIMPVEPETPEEVPSPVFQVPDTDVQGSSPVVDMQGTGTPAVPPCACAADGVSGGVKTGKEGCQEHVQGWPSFCYVVNPYGCFLSKPSQRFVGARWRNCTLVEDDVGSGSTTQFDVLSQVADSEQSSPPPILVTNQSPATTGNSGPCSCSPTGTSGTVQTGRPGCVEHVPGYSPFCYVLDPVNCFVARESTRYPSAGWRYCAIPNTDEREQPSKLQNVVRVTILPVFDPTTGESRFGMFLTPKE